MLYFLCFVTLYDIVSLFQAAAKKAEEERKRELKERQEREKEKELAAFLAAGKNRLVLRYTI